VTEAPFPNTGPRKRRLRSNPRAGRAQAPGLAEIALVDALVKGSPVADLPDLIGRFAEQQWPGPAH
jgi:hypothetical protein